jgi:Icc-related predicted phosphoesterase
VRLLAFSDLHRDLRQADRLVERSSEADAVAAIGDLASVHSGLEETIAALAGIEVPTILVPGNNETEEAVRAASAEWPSATVLHGEAMNLEGVEFFGLGGGIPTTPWDWSFDLDEAEAAEQLEACPTGAVMLVHSPPYGHCDVSSAGVNLGSRAIADAIERKTPPLFLCGHIHESWGCESRIGSSRIVNLGPEGAVFDVEPGA